MEKPAYQLYRNTTLGQALQKTLDDFVSEQLIPDSLAKRVMDQFDKSINKTLPAKAKNKRVTNSDDLEFQIS
uniref:TFIIA_gamma_N domain-containing protein n=1 Tax=Caenorhabditis japonica TaxID=281687 RepID=A0A8R1DF12_CAEJA